MSNSKLEFSVGAISFKGEGGQEWLSKQLDKVIQAAPKMATIKPIQVPGQPDSNAPNGSTEEGEFSTSLAAYIKEKGGESNQVKRFFATADWLRRKGSQTLAAAMISKALKDNQQKKLSNPADCLNQCVGKGHCEKEGKGFFITPDGLKALGH